MGFSFHDVGFGQVVADGLAGLDDEKVIIPVAFDELFHKFITTSDFVVFPAEIVSAFLGVLLGLVGSRKVPVDEDGSLVFFDPILFGFHQVLGIIASVFFCVFDQEFFIAILAGHKFIAVFDPTDGVPVDAFMGVEILLIAAAAAEQQGHAVVAAGDDDGDVTVEAGNAVAAQAVAEQDGVVGLAGGVGGFVQLFLDLAAEDIRRIVQSLRHEHDVDDVLASGST